MTAATGFRGNGEPIVVDVPPYVPWEPLTDDQRTHVLSLIAREHRGTEPEIHALDRVIAKIEAERLKCQGVTTSDGTRLTDLIDRRLSKLSAYRSTLEGDW